MHHRLKILRSLNQLKTDIGFKVESQNELIITCKHKGNI